MARKIGAVTDNLCLKIYAQSI